MEKIGQDPKPSSNSLNSPNREIRIGLGSVEENIRKLYEATKMGCVQTLNTLLQEDPNLIQKAIVFSSNNNDTPLLHVSICHGHLEFTRLLLRLDPELAAEVDVFRRTPLHLASERGDLDAIEALLENNISRSACLAYDKDGLIPLHYGVIGGHVEVMQRLINARPQSIWMNPKNNHGTGTILHLCVESNHLEGIKLLLETFTNHVDEYFLNTTDDEGNTILDRSITLRQSEMVAYLLSIPEVKTSHSSGKEISGAESEKIIRRRRIKDGWDVLKKKKKKNTEFKGNWVEEVQGTIMLVATVIATVTFQAGLNPPGGVWEQDTQFNNNTVPAMSQSSTLYYKNFYSNFPNGTMFLAGTAIMAYQQQAWYFVYSLVNMVSFMASVAVILLIISRFPLKNKLCSWILVLAMSVAVVFLALGYLFGVRMVSFSAFDLLNDTSFIMVYNAAFLLFFGLVGLVVLYLVIRFLFFLLKTLFCTILKCIRTLCF